MDGSVSSSNKSNGRNAILRKRAKPLSKQPSQESVAKVKKKPSIKWPLFSRKNKVDLVFFDALNFTHFLFRCHNWYRSK